MRAAGLALIALLAGCNPAEAPGAPHAPAAPVAVPAAPAPRDASQLLSIQPDLAKDFDALPRIAGDSAEAGRINAEMTRMDDAARKARVECFADDVQYPDWVRTVGESMGDPRFLSLRVTDVLYCGGNHPNSTAFLVTYDLTTGREIDWASLMPARFVQPLERTDSAFDFSFTVSRSPALFAWFARRVRAESDLDAEWLEECDFYLKPGNDWSALTIELDAEHEGLGVGFASLPHATRNCYSYEVMPLAELRRIGAAPELIAAIETAHRQRNWRDSVGDAAPPVR